MRTLTTLGGALLLVLTLSVPFVPPADACIAAFGYTGTDINNAATISANVGASVNTAYLTAPANPSYNLVPEVDQIRAQTGPVFINLKTIIFNPNPTAVPDCTYYERGPSSTTKSNFAFRGNYKSRLDQWFATNQALFDWNGGQRRVYALVVHEEANNDCVEKWKLSHASKYVRDLINAYSEYSPIYVAIGIGLRNTPNGAVSHGLPVDSNGNIEKFTGWADLIGYTAYDIFNPANDSDSYNLNAETWSTISAKLDQALHPGQKTAVVIKGFCTTYDPNGTAQPAEYFWGVECPPYWTNWWKLGILADNWASYAASDSRNLFAIAFHWPTVDPNAWSGTEDLFTIWSNHGNITPNCSVPMLPTL